MYKQFHDISNFVHGFFSKTVYTMFFALSLLVIFFGVSGIIEHKSPENLASLASLGSGFITHFEYHALIIFGALCFTFSIWFMRKD